MRTSIKQASLSILALTFIFSPPYPIDGYEVSGIRRIKRLQMIVDGEIKNVEKPIPGALLSIDDIKLNLLSVKANDLSDLPSVNPDLQKKIDALFPGLHSSYSLTIMDITAGRAPRYAARKELNQYQPGSVGKLAIACGFFTEIKKIYPDSFEKRQDLMKTRIVKGGPWAMVDSHTVPFFDPEKKTLIKRTVQESDTFSLYEWLDHMLSVSNNGAASVCWRETILMRAFGGRYPMLTQEEADTYFKSTPKNELSEIANAVVNEPLRKLGISDEEWKLGSLFTRGASAIIPGKGGSTGTPAGLMKFLLALEKGKIVDENSSLEIKRLMYMTDRRIRYASSPALIDAAVYFKSGSLYKCKEEEGYTCGKYKGNVQNYMNSVAIVEHPDGTTYLVVLMSNVLKKNSGSDHQSLASRIDKAIRSEP